MSNDRSGAAPTPASNRTTPARLNRRELFDFATSGLAAVAVAGMLSTDRGLRAAGVDGQASDPPPHHPAKARRVVQIVLCGGFSHVDTFDYKPELARFHGKSLEGSQRPDVFFGKVGLIRQNDWDFKQRGDSGLWVSELFPHLAQVADELTVDPFDGGRDRRTIRRRRFRKTPAFD